MRLLSFLLIYLILNSCGSSGGTEPSAIATVKLSQYNNTDITNLEICPHRIRFKTSEDDADNDEDNTDLASLSIGAITLTSAGKVIADVSVKEATYSSVEIDLNTSCTSGKSLIFTNDNGTYSSTEKITLRYTGELKINGSFTLSLDPQKQIDILSGWSDGSEILDIDSVLRAVEGDLP